jgi:predicted RecA/RadA family phage recombinase
MAALSAARNTVRRGDHAYGALVEFKVATNTTIYQGGMVALNSSGYAKAAAAGDNIVVGVATETVANTGADGAVSIMVRRGAFWLANKGTDLVTQADIAVKAAAGLPAGPCYVEDDQTVRHTSTSSILAGRALAVDSTLGVLVEIV